VTGCNGKSQGPSGCIPIVPLSIVLDRLPFAHSTPLRTCLLGWLCWSSFRTETTISLEFAISVYLVYLRSVFSPSFQTTCIQKRHVA